jgi:hypothetical protein
MRKFVRPVSGALNIVWLVVAMAILSPGAALAQGKPAPAQAAPPPAEQPAVKQIALTEKQMEGALAAQKQMDAITGKLPENAKPDAKIIAQLEDAAKKNGFVNYDDYTNVVDNISIVLAGFDPATKKYVGPEAVIKAQIAQVEADKKMSPRDKKEALGELNEALKSPAPPLENKGNIDLVSKYYDRLGAALGDGQE